MSFPLSYSQYLLLCVLCALPISTPLPTPPHVLRPLASPSDALASIPEALPADATPLRQLRLTTDISPTTAYRPASARLSEPIFGTHSFVTLDPTPLDAPLRVELAALLVDGTPSGLAVAVTSYAGVASYSGIDLGEAQPRDANRRMSQLAGEPGSGIRNAEVFDAGEGAAAGAAAELWVQNAEAADGAGTVPPAGGRSTAGLFGTSGEFARRLLGLPALRARGVQGSALRQQRRVMAQGNYWAELKRRTGWKAKKGGVLGQAAAGEGSDKRVDWLVYEGIGEGDEGSEGARRRWLFEIDRSGGLGTYRAKRVDGWWGPGGMEVGRPSAENGRLEISRLPMFTSDALHYRQDGSLLLRRMEREHERAEGSVEAESARRAGRWACWLRWATGGLGCATGEVAVLE